MANTLMTREEWYQYVRDCVEEAEKTPRKTVFVLIEYDAFEGTACDVQVFTTRGLAEEYKKNGCFNFVTIHEQYIIGE